jgi:methylglutaconyl-CoA hydratase
MLQTEIQDRVAHLTLDRPQKRNAFNAELVNLLLEKIKEVNANPGVRAILIKGNGEAFSAGADLDYIQQLRGHTFGENIKDSANLASLFEAIYHSPKLTVSAVDGFALAGGCGLAAITDLCFATNKARFGYTEVRIGFIPAIVMVYLVRKIRLTHVSDLLLSGRIINADEAVEMGLITKVLEFESFYPLVNDRVHTIIRECSAESITRTKSLMRTVADLKHEDGLQAAINANAEARSTEDCIRGIEAFLNKEQINW